MHVVKFRSHYMARATIYPPKNAVLEHAKLAELTPPPQKAPPKRASLANIKAAMYEALMIGTPKRGTRAMNQGEFKLDIIEGHRKTSVMMRACLEDSKLENDDKFSCLLTLEYPPIRTLEHIFRSELLLAACFHIAKGLYLSAEGSTSEVAAIVKPGVSQRNMETALAAASLITPVTISTA